MQPETSNSNNGEKYGNYHSPSADGIKQTGRERRVKQRTAMNLRSADSFGRWTPVSTKRANLKTVGMGG